MFGQALELRREDRLRLRTRRPSRTARQADELIAMVDRGMTPMQALQAATMTSAELIEREHDLGRLAPGYLADVIAVPGDPSEDIKVTKEVRVRDEGRPDLQGRLSAQCRTGTTTSNAALATAAGP